MRANTIGLIPGAGGAVAVTGSANAGLGIGDVLEMSRTASNGKIVTINYDSSRAWNATGIVGGNNAMAGFIDFDLISVNGNSRNGEINAFCIEITEAFPDDPIEYTLVDPTGVPEENPPGTMTAAQSQVMQDLFYRYYGDVSESASETWASYSEEMTAFQLVIWEISHENFSDSNDESSIVSELDIQLGAMAATDTFNANVLSTAQEMIAALGSGGFYNFNSLLGGSSPSTQDLLIVVPSPAIAALAGLGLVGMRRRRR